MAWTNSRKALSIWQWRTEEPSIENSFLWRWDAVIGPASDELLRDKNPKPPMDSDLFISRCRKRLMDLTDEDCNDAECFEYCGKQIWNGF